MRFKLVDEAKKSSIVFVVFLVSAKVVTMLGNSVAPVGVNWTTWFCWPISDLSSCFPMRPMVHRVCMLNCVRTACPLAGTVWLGLCGIII